MNRRVVFGALIALSSLVMSACGYAIDLDALKAEIRAEYNKREGVTVTEVFMEMSGGKPAGYVRFTVMGVEVLHTCTTTVYDNGQASWMCQP